VHWYDRQGRPCYQQRSKGGTYRDTTLRDARAQNLVPSVSEILRVIAKPGLEIWKEKQHALAALTLPDQDRHADDATRMARIKADAQKQVTDAAAEGTRIHDAIEKHFKGERYDYRYERHVKGAADALAAAFPEIRDWQAEQSFCHPRGFGGRVDLFSRSGRTVGDTKSRDFGPEKLARDLAFEQYVQLAAYAEGLDLCRTARPAPRHRVELVTEPAVLFSLFVSRTHPGLALVHPWEPERCLRGLRQFYGAFDVFCGQRDFDPWFGERG
jgi:hypothetical protein